MTMFQVTAVVSTTVTILVAPFFIAVAALLYAFAVRRLLGLRLGGLRTLIAGVLAFLVASPIITALFGNNSSKNSGILPALWFVILGTAIALLAGMTFLVVAETFVPTGSVPGPFYLANRLRKWIGRTKRYSQIMRILQRRGLLPYLRGSRRSELRISDGRAPVWPARFALLLRTAASPSSNSGRCSRPAVTCCPMSSSRN
jgi:ubiquinone biosynthesis protein